MANMRVVVPIFLLIASIIASGSEAYVSCNTVQSYLYPCAVYVVQGGAIPLATCCTNMRTLKGQAKTTSDRQGICSCIKNALVGLHVSATHLKSAAAMPAKCGVTLPYKIDPSTSCNRVQ